jgi:hypothetical protein
MKRNRNRNGYRRVPLNKEMIALLDEQHQRFIAKFGREPRGEDPIFWDENADQPEPVSEEQIHQIILQAITAAGSPPEFIHAFKKTGLLVTETNQHLISPAHYQAWVDAVEEYCLLN